MQYSAGRHFAKTCSIFPSAPADLQTFSAPALDEYVHFRVDPLQPDDPKRCNFVLFFHLSFGRILAVTENMAAPLKKRKWLIFDAFGSPVVPDV